MRIGIDCRLWGTTTGRYIRENVNALAKLDHENEYVLFFTSDHINEFEAPKNFKKIKADIAYHTFSEQILMPVIFLKEKLDLLHVPYFNVPLLYPKKFIATIHDLTILRTATGRASTLNPVLYAIKRLGFKIALLYGVFRSYKIITVSQYVKDDIVKTFKINSEKVEVIYNGVGENFKRVSDEEVNEILPIYNIRKPYLFYVGNAHPHKNVEGLIKAFTKVSLKFPNLSLVIGGKKDFFVERIMDEFKNDSVLDKVVFTGYIDDEDLPALYSGAEAYVTASFAEGFGLQVLEAFACGTPVICSNITSLPEVGGGVAFYFNPNNIEDIANGIIKALHSNSAERIEEGYKRARHFSWQISAQKHLKLYMG